MEKSKSGLLAVSKRTLLLVAGLVWGFAGLRVFTLGGGDVSLHNGNIIISIVFSKFIELIKNVKPAKNNAAPSPI